MSFGALAFLNPWLLAALVTHASLGLYKLAGRGTLQLPRWELIQILLGISIPFLLLPHIINTRIAHVSGPDTFRSAHERRAGFVKGLKANKLKLEKELDVRAAYTFASGVEAGRRLMALDAPPMFASSKRLPG